MVGEEVTSSVTSISSNGPETLGESKKCMKWAWSFFPRLGLYGLNGGPYLLLFANCESGPKQPLYIRRRHFSTPLMNSLDGPIIWALKI